MTMRTKEPQLLTLCKELYSQMDALRAVIFFTTSNQGSPREYLQASPSERKQLKLNQKTVWAPLYALVHRLSCLAMVYDKLDPVTQSQLGHFSLYAGKDEAVKLAMEQLSAAMNALRESAKQNPALPVRTLVWGLADQARNTLELVQGLEPILYFFQKEFPALKQPKGWASIVRQHKKTRMPKEQLLKPSRLSDLIQVVQPSPAVSLVEQLVGEDLKRLDQWLMLKLNDPTFAMNPKGRQEVAQHCNELAQKLVQAVEAAYEKKEKEKEAQAWQNLKPKLEQLAQNATPAEVAILKRLLEAEAKVKSSSN